MTIRNESPAGPKAPADRGAATHGSDGDDTVRSWWSRNETSVKLLLAALPVTGLLAYGLLRQLYAKFYGALGAAPEDVGLGYSELLALSALGALVLFLPGLAIVYFSTGGLRRGFRRAAAYVVVAVALSSAWLWIQTAIAADGAVRGQTVRSVNLLGVQVLGLRAEPALLTWTGSEAPPVDFDRCYLYLGQANGITVLFDPGPPLVRTIRVNTDSVVVAVIRAESARGPYSGATCLDGALRYP